MASVLSKAFPAALKEFLQSNYATIKQNNPKVPFLIREAQDTPARVFVRFERGVEKHAELDGLDNAEVTKKFSELLS